MMRKKYGKKLLIVLALVLALSMAFGACSSDTDVDNPVDDNPSGGDDATTDEPLMVGFIYIGTAHDGGYTEAQNNGVEALKAELGDKIDVKIMESIDDTNPQAAKEAAESLIDQGCKVVVGTSYGFGAPLIELANSGDYNDVVFLHFSDPAAHDGANGNLTNYFGAMEQPRYLSGIIAGMQTTTNKVGYVAAYPYTEVQIGINAFALGVQSVNPSATVEVRYINSWYDPAKEKAAAEALLAAGCDIITQHADTTGPQLAAADAGKLTIGYNLDNSAKDGLADAFLTAPVWHHEKYLIPTIQAILDGTWKPESGTPFDYYGTLADGYVGLAPLTKNVTEDAKAKVEEARSKIISGELQVFTGPIEYADGTVLVAEGESLDTVGIWNINGVIKGVNASEQN